MDFSTSRMLAGSNDYQLDSDSDSEAIQSSDDEIDQFLHGTPEQKRRIRRRSLGKDSSSEDEFEKEMELQLNATMKDMQQPEGSTGKQGAAGGFYDNIYFDSDSDENEKSEDKKTKKHRVLSNDELLYNPQEDEENQQWVNSQRLGNQLRSGGKKSTQKAAPSSDATLNCPACMTTLCVDCQRHDLYKHQYRAMFVMNCTTDEEEVLKYPKTDMGKKNRRKRKHKESKNIISPETSVVNNPSVSHEQSHKTVVSHDETQDIVLPNDQNAAISPDQSQNASVSHDQSQNAGEDMYHPVRCAECKTEVGVYDSNEIYHFYNVLASY